MMEKKKSFLSQIPGFKKSRKYPIRYDEYGRSLRRQAFDFFDERYRPSQIFKESLIPVSMKTLLRYFEDWKKNKHRASRSVLRNIMKKNPESTEKYVQTLADYFEVPPQDIILRIQRPWGIEQLTRGELPDKKLARLQSEKEVRLEAALRLIAWGERVHKNSPEQVLELMWEIMTLSNNTKLEIIKYDGKLAVKKERLQETNRLEYRK